jgi:hypothetical protein
VVLAAEMAKKVNRRSKSELSIQSPSIDAAERAARWQTNRSPGTITASVERVSRRPFQ